MQKINRFIRDAPDSEYLLEKVTLIIGICGACRRCELVNLEMKDVKDLGSVFVVTVIDSSTNEDRTFTVPETFCDILRKYIAFRPIGANSRFFLNYQNQRCKNRPVGKNKLAKYPFKIATYLGLAEPDAYTGHCFRRSSLAIKVVYGENWMLRESSFDLVGGLIRLLQKKCFYESRLFAGTQGRVSRILLLQLMS